MSSEPASASAPLSPPPAWLIELGWGERYELVEVIGRGGMGQVWKAIDLKTLEMVALKVLDPSRVGDDHLLARLETEAATLRSLLVAGQHEHIVPVLDFAARDAHACMVMAFIPGQDLRTWCETRRLDLASRVALVEQVARAAGWCHQHGVVHRDLKPANILVHAASGQPVIVDFSIAKRAGHLPITLTGEALGTAPYMAPEQLDSRRGAVTPCADVYALGATLYELLTHVPPHPGGLPQVMERHRNEVRPARPSVLNANVPKDLDSICLKALANRPAERYGDGTQLADDLACFLAGRPVAARPLSTPAHLLRQARRHPALCASLAVSLVLVGGFAWETQQVRQARRVDSLRQVITAAMRGRGWDAESLDRTRQAVDQLAMLDPARAKQMRAAWHDDVVDDLQASLGEARLGEGSAAWMIPTLNWLRQVDAPAAERLQAQLNERLERWETFAEVRPPFTDFNGLFPNHNVRKDGNSLLPVPRAGDHPQSCQVMVKQPMVSPCDVTVSFTPPAEGLQSVALDFEFQKVRTRVMLASFSVVSTETLRFVGGKEAASGFCVLYLERNGRFARGMVIPVAALVREPFKLSVRVEPDHVRCQVNDRWTLRLDEEFIIPHFTQQNSFQLSWQRNLRLNWMVIKNRGEKPMTSQLEKGDVLAAQGRWAEAQRSFEAHRGDASYGEEAAWKAAFAAYQQDQVKEALESWLAILQHPVSPWRDLALYELWKHYVLHSGTEDAAPFLKLLPAASKTRVAFRTHITDEDRKNLAARYQDAGSGANVLRPNIEEVSQAVKAMELLDIPALDIASHFATAYHFSGLDEAARQMWINGFDDLAKHGWSAPGQGSASLTATTCLDYWCRIDKSEKQQRLGEWLASGRKACPSDPNLWALVREEQSRVLVRAGRRDEAVEAVAGIAATTSVSRDRRLSALLLKGMSERQLGHEETALATWHQALEIAKDDSRTLNTLNLCDLSAVHCLVRDWDPDKVTDIVLKLVGKTRAGTAGVALQGRIASTLLADPAFIAVLQKLDRDAQGRQLLVDYVLVNEPARHLARRAMTLLVEHYLANTAFPSGVRAEDAGRIRETVSYLLPTGGADAPDGLDVFSFLEAWASPQKKAALPPAVNPAPPDPLHARLRWLVAERYMSHGNAAAARPLLLSAQGEPSLNPEWRHRIEALLKACGQE